MATRISNDAEQHLHTEFVSAKPRSAQREDAQVVRLRADKAPPRDGDGSPSIRRYPGIVRVGIALGGAAACWAVIAGVLAAVS